MVRCSLLVAGVSLLVTTALSPAAASPKEARLSQVIREVSLLPATGAARRAILNEMVPETSAVKTGGDSRAELTFQDQTITRLGANTLFRFTKAGRRGELDSGSTLLRVPPRSGGATIFASAITAADTGTTFIFEHVRNGGTRIVVLEGSARLSFVKNQSEFRNVAAGQMVEVPPGATRFPEPKTVDISQIVRTSPLIVGFRPLPSINLINNAIRQQQQRGQFNQNQPNHNAPPGPQGPQGPQNAAPPPGAGPR